MLHLWTPPPSLLTWTFEHLLDFSQSHRSKAAGISVSPPWHPHCARASCTPSLFFILTARIQHVFLCVAWQCCQIPRLLSMNFILQDRAHHFIVALHHLQTFVEIFIVIWGNAPVYPTTSPWRKCSSFFCFLGNMSGCRVFIGRLSPHARERDVEKFFKGYGRIREINLKSGFGFVVSFPWPVTQSREELPLLF